MGAFKKRKNYGNANASATRALTASVNIDALNARTAMIPDSVKLTKKLPRKRTYIV